MNILFVSFSLNPEHGGIQRYCHTLMTDLKKEGHSLTLLLFDEKTPSDPSLGTFISLSSFCGTEHFFKRARLKAKLKTKFKEKKFDQILCGHINLGAFCQELSMAFQSSWKLFAYGIECWGHRFKNQNFDYNYLKSVISISSFTSKQLVLQACPAEKIAYFPPLVEDKAEKIAYFPPLVEDKVEKIAYTNNRGTSSLSSSDLSANPSLLEDKLKKDQSEKSEKDFIVLTVARLDASEQYKGHDEVIKALPAMLIAIPNVRYWIVGKGNDQPRLEKLAQDLGVSGSVRFLGFVPELELSKVYAESDLFVMPSRVSLDSLKPEGEGFGIVFVEAALFSKALIASNIGGQTDIIENGKNGLLVDLANSQALADALIYLAKNKELCKLMGLNARKMALEKFSLNQISRYRAFLLD